jgi:hypothetical protein
MSIIPIISFLARLAVDSWLLAILWRRNIWKTLPWFASYIASELVTTCVGLALWSINKRFYVTVFWWMEAVLIGLLVGAVRESFVRTFVGLRSLRWFPWVVRSVIGGVIGYSVLKAIYAPPVQGNRIIAFIIAGEFTSRWGIVAVGLLAVVLVWLFSMPNDTHEVAVMNGCVMASVAFLVWTVTLSFTGTKYALIMQYVPDMGYLLGASLWIKYMLRSEVEFGFKELGISPEQMALELHRYRKAAERILGKRKEK